MAVKKTHFTKAHAVTCGDNEFAGGVLAEATASKRAKAVTAARKAAKSEATKLAKVDAARGCPGKCSKKTPKKISLGLTTVKTITSSRIKKGSFVAYASAGWKVKFNCSKPKG